MLELLWVVPAFPLAGFLGLVLIGARMRRAHVALIGVGSVGLSALIGVALALRFISAPPPGRVYTQTLWRWLAVGDFTPTLSLYLDALSLVLLVVVTTVSFLIHLYAAEFMSEEEGYSRFFAYMNLFVAAMLTLVLAGDLLLLYLGWEGVGLCSYLLIGFWYRDPANGRAAQKAFIVTRVGDTALAVGLLLLFTTLGTLNIQEVMSRALQAWPVGSQLATATAALLLIGALGKSAQLPLQVWLPDAMAGPTPVSALIHAATMVTAGVYLVARTHVLFALSPLVLSAVAVIGALTLLLAGCSALTQRDIKRVLAYSTMSQIGYMFLALGVGAWSAAIFHLVTHAFFKALLFLAAGSVILSLHEEHDIFRMGGLRRHLPVTFWTFLIGAASLAGFPLVTAGFYSKDWILWRAWSGPGSSPWLWAAGSLGALLTGLYSFRLVFRVFFGEVKTPPMVGKTGVRMRFALVTLAVLSIVAGWLELPATLGRLPLFSTFLGTAAPVPRAGHAGVLTEGLLQIIAGGVSLLGIALAYLLFLKGSGLTERLTHTPLGAAVQRWWFSGWGFDWLYERLVVEPFLAIAQLNKGDAIDAVYGWIAHLHRQAHGLLSRTQTGRVRWYAAGLVAGAVGVIALVVWL